MRILVIEDEPKVGCFIKRALEEESYAVDLCEDGAKGLQMALITNYDLLIVDLMLPSLPSFHMIPMAFLARTNTATNATRRWPRTWRRSRRRPT